VNSARTDLCGGRPAMGVPTANLRAGFLHVLSGVFPSPKLDLITSPGADEVRPFRHYETRIEARLFLSGVATLCNSATNSLAIAFGVRFLRVTTSVGGAFMDSLTGNILIRSRPAPKWSVEPGRNVRNRPISTKRVRTVVESEITCGVGVLRPAERNPSSISLLATLSGSGIAQGSSKRSLRSILP